MKHSLVKHLVCPETQCPLALEVIEEVNGEVRTGVLKSRNGRAYPIERFVPRFVRSDEYASTFSEQRKHVRRHFSDYRRDRVDELTDDLFFRSTGFDPAGFAGLTLDAGCGYGRFLSVIERQGGEVIGVDLSAESAALAYEAAGTRPNVHVVNADLARLPFRRGYFQRIFSIGVLHHTPNPQRSFEDLVSHLSEGGEIAVWVYAPGEKSTSDAWRKVTTKLPLGVVYVWCVVNEVLFAWVRSLPKGGGRFGTVIPGGTLETPFWLRVMGDFDDLTPKYAFTYTGEQLQRWFAEAGLIDVRILPRPTAAYGRMRPNSAWPS